MKKWFMYIESHGDGQTVAFDTQAEAEDFAIARYEQLHPLDKKKVTSCYVFVDEVAEMGCPLHFEGNVGLVLV